MNKTTKYESGDKYGRLTLTGKSYINNKHERYVEAICECGKTKFFILRNLKRGNTKSCRCYHKDKITTHGMARESLYKVWGGMKQRCYNEENPYYHNYGGRDIKICDEWLDFENFKKWAIGNGWEHGLCIDRINNDGNYEPLNCRWTTNKVQSRNKRTNLFFEAFGERKCLKDWVNDPRCSIGHPSLQKRLRKGWSIEDAISKPSTSYNKNHIYK